MYKIFCITESKYLNAFYQYLRDAEYDFDRLRISYSRTSLSPKITISDGWAIVNNPTEFNGNEHYSSKVFVLQPLIFNTITEVKTFVSMWFSSQFTGVYKENQFHRDSARLYANPIELELPADCFEVHDINEANVIVGVAPICDFIPFKR